MATATMEMPGVIDPALLYQKREFMKRAGLTPASYRAAVRRGLKIIMSGKRAWIRGSDWAAYLDRMAVINTEATDPGN